MKIKGGVISKLNLLFQRKLSISTKNTLPYMKLHVKKIENPDIPIYQAENFLRAHWPH